MKDTEEEDDKRKYTLAFYIIKYACCIRLNNTHSFADLNREIQIAVREMCRQKQFSTQIVNHFTTIREVVQSEYQN